MPIMLILEDLPFGRALISNSSVEYWQQPFSKWFLETWKVYLLKKNRSVTTKDIRVSFTHQLIHVKDLIKGKLTGRRAQRVTALQNMLQKSSQKRATLDENEANLSSGKRGRNEEPDTSDFDENRLSMTPTRTQVIARTILTPNKPTVSKSMYDNYAAHVIYAFHATLGYVKATSEERFYEDIKKMLEVGNQLVLTESCYETGSNI
ncbi:hypothetical protein BC938DRAFT_483865 [Jimgerdemannia flammicorona]|uniref:Uncharacterized protein n=1 Tax=Jimgerdemannia flammicorona TaxID=994334 RepID=A0A433QB83_9FUNG|nr:hypothetical protein BC938DRAFT_483865 [Jimgerdemannia flammicorona]